MSYKKDIKIDKYDLDNEWCKQSHMVVKYGDLSVDANKMKEQAELEVEILEQDLKSLLAKLSLEVKKNFKLGGFEKVPSDTSATSWAITQDEYREKQRELFAAREEQIEARDLAFRLRNVARAFEERRFGLQNLQSLFLSGYYSDSGRDGQKMSEGVSENMRKRK